MSVPAGGGAVFDVKIDEPGLYPFVSHSFAHVDLGQVGLLKVGDPKGHMQPLRCGASACRAWDPALTSTGFRWEPAVIPCG